jgi:hypothetical protein
MSNAVCRHRLHGLEPDNLLAFLALLGLLRAIETSRPDWRPRAAWDIDQPPLRPWLLTAEPATPEAISQAAAKGAIRLAESYEFSPEDSHAVSQKDLDYTPVYARELLSKAVAEEKRECADLWAALMCDLAAKGGHVEPTPLCLLFGQGHQHFLDRLTIVPRTAAPPPRGRGRRTVTLTAADASRSSVRTVGTAGSNSRVPLGPG